MFGHTQMGYKEHFPPLKALGPRNVSAEVMRLGWLECNNTFLMMGMCMLLSLHRIKSACSVHVFWYVGRRVAGSCAGGGVA